MASSDGTAAPFHAFWQAGYEGADHGMVASHWT